MTSKYVITLPTTQKNSSFSKDLGNNEQLAYNLARVYFDANQDGYIDLVEPVGDRFAVRLPNPKYLVNPANCDEPWLYQKEFDTKEDAIALAIEHGANSHGCILIVDNDFLEEFGEVHLVLYLKRYHEHPELDLENIYRGGIMDEYVSAFEQLTEEISQKHPGSVFNLIREIEIDLEATDATLIC